MEKKILFLVLLLSSRHMPNSLNLGLMVEKGRRYVDLLEHKKKLSCFAKTRTEVVIFKSRYCHKKTYLNFQKKRNHLVFSTSKQKKPPKIIDGFYFFHVPINPWGKIYFIK